MKQRRGFFWIGMLLAGGIVFHWVRRRLDATDRKQQPPSAAAPNRPPVAPQPAAKPVQAAPKSLPDSTSVGADNLEEINGIGATYARRLHAAGIHTFAALAALTPAEALELAKAQPWQADTAAWIAQAEERSGQ